MQNDQSNQRLAIAIEQAIADPGAADLKELLQEFEQSLLGLSQEHQLRVAGNILFQLVEIYASRAEQLLDLWEEKYTLVQAEPVLTADMLQEVLRQSMTLNLESVIQETPLLLLPSQPTDSVIGEVDQAHLLAFLNQVEEEAAQQEALQLAHDEDISAWVRAISDYIATHKTHEISLLELQRSLNMTLIQIWLALLLGGFVLEQRGDFYQLNGISVLTSSK